MPLNIPGGVGGKGKVTQGIQGMSKGPASSGISPSGKSVMKMGIKSKTSPHMKVKSKKKKVIVHALLGMLNDGKRKMMSNDSGQA